MSNEKVLDFKDVFRIECPTCNSFNIEVAGINIKTHEAVRIIQEGPYLDIDEIHGMTKELTLRMDMICLDCSSCGNNYAFFIELINNEYKNMTIRVNKELIKEHTTNNIN